MDIFRREPCFFCAFLAGPEESSLYRQPSSLELFNAFLLRAHASFVRAQVDGMGWDEDETGALLNERAKVCEAVLCEHRRAALLHHLKCISYGLIPYECHGYADHRNISHGCSRVSEDTKSGHRPAESKTSERSP